jgi:hypothetical protein
MNSDFRLPIRKKSLLTVREINFDVFPIALDKYKYRKVKRIHNLIVVAYENGHGDLLVGFVKDLATYNFKFEVIYEKGDYAFLKVEGFYPQSMFK